MRSHRRPAAAKPARGRPTESRILTAVVVVVGLLASLGLTTAAPAASEVGPGAAPAAGAPYQSLNPSRLADTRPGGTTVDGQFAATGALGPNGSIDLTTLGRGGVPSGGVSAVVVNITIVNPSASTHLTVWPTGTSRPNSSNLNAAPGDTVANLTIAKLGTGGKISVFNNAGNSHVVVDVNGWFPTGSDYTGIDPDRLTDTRRGGTTVDGQHAGTGPVFPGDDELVTVVGRGGVPATGVAAVVVNITAINSTTFGAPAPTHLTAYPTGSPRPTASNVNVAAGQTLPNLAIVKVGFGGQISIFDNSSFIHLVVDVVGWFPTGDGYTALEPARLLDTRGGPVVDGPSVFSPLPVQASITIHVAGRGGVPATGAGAVVVNVTAVNPVTATHLTVYPALTTRPEASNVNAAAGQNIAGLAIARLGEGGQITIFNNGGPTHVVVDVVGWFPATGSEPPTFTVSPVVGGLSHPWDIGFTPDGTMLFTERFGPISALINGTKHVMADPPDSIEVFEGGMMGIAVDPLFATNRLIYTCTLHGDAGFNIVDIRVIRWHVADDYSSLSDRTDILTGIPTQTGGSVFHAGCRTRFGPDGYLWVTTGDGLAPNPQNHQSLAGKVLRMDRDGNGAPGNAGGDFLPQIYTYGHRNPQGIAFSPVDGQAFDIEHGPNADDEVNKLVAGGNYGWDAVSGIMTDHNLYPDAIDPVWASGVPTIAPSGATFLTGPQWKGWNGALAVAVLKGQQVRIFKLNPDGSLNSQEITLTTFGRLRAATQGPDGSLYLSQDMDAGSQILKVTPT